MKTEIVKSLKLEFENEEADRVKSIFKKVMEEVTKTGFQNILDKDEITLVKDLNEKLK